MSQQMDPNVSSKALHDCIQSNANNESVLVVDVSAIKIKDSINPIPLKSVESNIEMTAKMSAESTTDSEPQINCQKSDQSVQNPEQEVWVTPEEAVETDIESKCEPNIGSDSVPQTESQSENESKIDLNTDSETESKAEPKTQSIGYSKAVKYVRKSPTELLIKMWQILDSNEWFKSVEELNKSLIQKMLNEFNIKLNDNRVKQLTESLIADKLVVTEEKDNKIKFVLNFDRKLFGELTNDWLCFECHSVCEGEDLIGCEKCFKSFHFRCLKATDLKDESFECLYCRRSTERDPNLNVDRLTKGELNKCISFVVNNLQLSYETQGFDRLSIDKSEQNSVLLFKPMDVMDIRLKALTDQYNTLEEAVTDFKHFIHNFHICRKDETTVVREFERRLNHEIKELKLCVDCYKYSSDISYDTEEDPHDWFTLVCDPPHELVFAKYGKYPWWPAKVIEIKPGGKQYDVRFFDAPDFSRAIVPLQRLRPIDNFEFEDEDNELELPIRLMEKHINKMRLKSVCFIPTVVRPQKKSAQKRANTHPNGTDRPSKRAKKRADN